MTTLGVAMTPGDVAGSTLHRVFTTVNGVFKKLHVVLTTVNDAVTKVDQVLATQNH